MMMMMMPKFLCLLAAMFVYVNGLHVTEEPLEVSNDQVQRHRLGHGLYYPGIPSIPRYLLYGRSPVFAAASKRSMTLGRSNFRPGKRSLDTGVDLSPDLVDYFNSIDSSMQGNAEEKRSAALGRIRFRPGKRDELDYLERMTPYGAYGFSLLTEAQMGKRSGAIGRIGFRPAKRSMAMGRSRFRPGKRSIATGRTGFRPGKRGSPLVVAAVPILGGDADE